MADFLEAYKSMERNEGGYAFVAGDSGGETYAGISRKWFPNWEGWEIVDDNKPLKHNEVIKSTKLESLKRQFYKRTFWDAVKGDFIEDQLTAKRLFDFGVNAGKPVSIKQIQKSLGVKETGIIDSELIEAINHPGKYLIQ